MTWTTEKPTKPGLYWAWSKRFGLVLIKAEDIFVGHLTFIVLHQHEPHITNIDVFTHFMPIERPEPPQE